ncbi:MAG TPA: asparagine synthase (glutamine-hydrolyzing) [Thermoplasmata archaeon]|nr:asparagine synthase (glutamine-hydrolyzing) [Thermoplasmata archaeon]
MCGINGVNRGDERLVRAMNGILHHRGPDDEGTFVDSGIALGCCRLKVIDLTSAGHQPLQNEEGTRWIVFNGEVYNYRQLRAELTAMGRPFRSESDTEVVLQAYEAWGIDFLDHLEGMWAVAIYDAALQELYLARDRMGIKPLYYLAEGMTFAFSSELKTFTVPPLRRPLDPQGLRELVALGFNPVRRTCLRNVWKLRSGELLRYSLRDLQFRTRRYWRRNPPRESESDGVATVPQVVRAAVESNLVSDVPVGTYLSGGIDSSLVTLLYAQAYPGKLRTYTVGFDEGRDERPFAQAVAELAGSEYHEVTISPHDLEQQFDRISYAYDLTLTDPAFVPNYFLARRAKQDVTVVLAGEGGDELFGGYDYYRSFRLARATGLSSLVGGVGRLMPWSEGGGPWGAATRKGFTTIGHLDGSAGYVVDLYSPLPVDRVVRMLDGYAPSLLQRDILSETQQEQIPPGNGAFLLYDQMFLLAEKFNPKADKASAFFSIEERVPLQERSVVDLANRLPLRAKLGLTQGKLPLRALLASEAPLISRRRKQGFEPPISAWLRGPLAGRLETAVRRLSDLGAVRPHGVDALLTKVSQGGASTNELRFAWNLLAVGAGLGQYGYGG